MNPRHLRWATHAENMADSRGKRPRRVTNKWPSLKGSDHGRARLTEEQVADIRAATSMGSRQKDLAAQYGVHRTTIHYAVVGKNWAHVA